MAQAKVKPDPIDPVYENMNLEEVNSEIERLKNMLKEQKTKRNYVQQERDLIESYYNISINEEKMLFAQIENIEKEKEKIQTENKVEIAAYSNKYQHLEYEHDIFINKTLQNEAQLAVEDEEKIRQQRESIYFNDKQDLKYNLKLENDQNRAQIDKEQALLKKTLDTFDKKMKDNLKTIRNNYEEKIKNLEADLELRLKIEIHELEERKNLKRKILVKNFEERTNVWKQENINQIKENINMIKLYSSLYEDRVEENKQLMKEEQELIKLIIVKRQELESSKQKHSELMNRLAKYYNQEINMTNMKKKISSLKEKIKEVNLKGEEALNKKDELTKEIDEIEKKYEIAIKKFIERAEFKNALLDNQLSILTERLLRKDSDIENIFLNVDQFARNEGDINREALQNFLEEIRNTLSAKTQIIKSLKFSIDKATKAYNDTIRIYEAKLIDFGIPSEELGYQIIESKTSKMPAGLVSA